MDGGDNVEAPADESFDFYVNDDFYGEGLRETIRAFFRGRTQLEPKSRAVLEQYGNMPIIQASVHRQPIETVPRTVIDLLLRATGSSLKELLRKYSYDDLFHLFIRFVVKTPAGARVGIIVEKNETPKITVGDRGGMKRPVDLKGRVWTLNGLLDRTLDRLGPRKFYNYVASNTGDGTNCQGFLQAILMSGGLMTAELNEFIMQDARAIYSQLPGFAKPVSDAATTVLDKLNILQDGAGHAELIPDAQIGSGRRPLRIVEHNGKRFVYNDGKLIELKSKLSTRKLRAALFKKPRRIRKRARAPASSKTGREVPAVTSASSAALPIDPAAKPVSTKFNELSVTKDAETKLTLLEREQKKLVEEAASDRKLFLKLAATKTKDAEGAMEKMRMLTGVADNLKANQALLTAPGATPAMLKEAERNDDVHERLHQEIARLKAQNDKLVSSNAELVKTITAGNATVGALTGDKKAADAAAKEAERAAKEAERAAKEAEARAKVEARAREKAEREAERAQRKADAKAAYRKLYDTANERLVSRQTEVIKEFKKSLGKNDQARADTLSAALRAANVGGEFVDGLTPGTNRTKPDELIRRIAAKVNFDRWVDGNDNPISAEQLVALYRRELETPTDEQKKEDSLMLWLLKGEERKQMEAAISTIESIENEANVAEADKLVESLAATAATPDRADDGGAGVEDTGGMESFADEGVADAGASSKDEEPPKVGAGEAMRGLYDWQLERILKPLRPHGFLGVHSIDELPGLVAHIPADTQQFSLVYNTMPSTIPTGHWVGFLYSEPEGSVEVYDSLAEPVQPEVLQFIQAVVNKLKPAVYLKLKHNLIRAQGKSQLCGFHVLRWLEGRILDKRPFKEVSGYSAIRESEKSLRGFIAKNERRFAFV